MKPNTFLFIKSLLSPKTRTQYKLITSGEFTSVIDSSCCSDKLQLVVQELSTELESSKSLGRGDTGCLLLRTEHTLKTRNRNGRDNVVICRITHSTYRKTKQLISYFCNVSKEQRTERLSRSWEFGSHCSVVLLHLFLSVTFLMSNFPEDSSLGSTLGGIPHWRLQTPGVRALGTDVVGKGVQRS